MVDNPDSLIPRFYGVYGVKQLHGRTVRFVVMGNIFCTDLQMHRRFDLKVGGISDGCGCM
jgi:1-phosphatidylinositol-4-phosphate 5-kinase